MTNILIGLAVVVLVLARQLRTQPLREQSSVKLALILGAIGFLDTVQAAKTGTVGPVAVALIVFGLALGVLFGVLRAFTVRIWRDGDGVAFSRGTALTALLWVVAIASHLGLDVLLDHAAGAGVGSAGILLYLAVSLGVQRETLRWRAASAAARDGATPVAPARTVGE